MICFPLDNTPCEAKDMGIYLATRTRGVFSSDGNLAVTPGESGLSVSVSPGLAWLKWSDFWGVAALQAQALTLDLDTADGALKRIDAIVCRLDKVNNRAEIVVKKGSFSSSPVLLPPVRDANYDELYIATVLIGAGIVSISASAITDQRLNEEYCGLMRDGVTGIPTAQLQTQVQGLIDQLVSLLQGVTDRTELMLKTVYDPQGRNTDIFAAIPNPNLGTNTNFPNPINQRGAASYTGDSTSPYCIDRWRISNGTTYTVGTFTLSAANYANRACGMWQSNEMGAHQLSIGDDVTVSIYANGQLHTAVIQVLDRDSYNSFADVPAGYTCDDFEIVLCTYAQDTTKYNLGIYPKKPLTVNYIKWEKGSVATPYVPKGYGAELAECMRYFQRIFVDWRTYPPLNNLIYRIPMTALQVMRVKPSVTKPTTPYTFGCDITGMDAQQTSFAVQVTVNETGLNSGAAALSGHFDLSADL